MSSRTKQAVRWLNESPGRTQYAAAKIFGIAQSAISVAIQRQSECIELWKQHGEAIERGQVRHITTKDHQRAIRGREILRELDGKPSCRPERRRNKTSEALEWLAVTENATVREAATRFGISVPTIYAGRSIEANRMRALEEVGPDVCDKVAKRAEEFPSENLIHLATYFEVPLDKLRDAMTARETLARRSVTRKKSSEYINGYKEGLAAAAKIAEMIGGEHGAAVAASIRSVEV